MPLNVSVQRGSASLPQMPERKGGKLSGSTPVSLALVNSCTALLLRGVDATAALSPLTLCSVRLTPLSLYVLQEQKTQKSQKLSKTGVIR